MKRRCRIPQTRETGLEQLDGRRTRITYRTEITGPAADQVGPELGPAITEDFPDVLAALVQLTEA